MRKIEEILTNTAPKSKVCFSSLYHRMEILTKRMTSGGFVYRGINALWAKINLIERYSNRKWVWGAAGTAETAVTAPGRVCPSTLHWGSVDGDPSFMRVVVTRSWHGLVSLGGEMTQSTRDVPLYVAGTSFSLGQRFL